MDVPPVRGLHCSPSQRGTVHTAARKGSETATQACPAHCWNKSQLSVFSDILHTTILAFILEFFLAHTAKQNKDMNLSTQNTALGTNQFFFRDDAENKTMP